MPKGKGYPKGKSTAKMPNMSKPKTGKARGGKK